MIYLEIQQQEVQTKKLITDESEPTHVLTLENQLESENASPQRIK